MKHVIAIIRAAAAAAASLMLAAQSALAHHAMGGETPVTAWQGLLSGLAHPVIGPDHLAFVVAVGLASGLAGNGLLLPLLFIAGTISGCLVHVRGLDMPFAELAIVASLFAAAVIVAAPLRLRAGVLAALLAVSGLVHGYAYGESIVGAEPTPLAAYIVGFGIIQLGIAVAAARVMQALAGSGRVSETLALRSAGAVIALVALGSLAATVMAA